jgi:hypothetical protein
MTLISLSALQAAPRLRGCNKTILLHLFKTNKNMKGIRIVYGSLGS